MEFGGPGRISDCPAAVARRFPGREAAVLGEVRLSYAELAREVDRCARGLLAAGIGKGDRVAMLSTPRPEYLVVLLATIRIGAIWTGLNPVHGLDEYRQVLEDCRPRLLFAFLHLRGRDNRALLAELRRACPFLEGLVAFDLTSTHPHPVPLPPSGRGDAVEAAGFGRPLARAAGEGGGGGEGLTRLTPGTSDDDAGAVPYDDFLRAGESVGAESYAAAAAAVRPADIALLVHTSGSTGRPKGAMITHGNLVHCARVQLQLLPVAPLRALCNLPASHIGCSSDIVSYTLAGGGTLVFQERFDPAGALALIERERVSWILQIPAMLQRMLAVPDRTRFDTSSLRVVLFEGAPMPPAMIAELQGLGGTVHTTWGMTETTCSVTYTEAGDGIAVLAQTVGRPAGCEVRIAGADGRPLPAESDAAGEILVRGACVMAGYFERPAETAAAIDEAGWLHTGDIGRFGADGRLRFVGRIREMFKSGGYNVYPREIETVLESHPAAALAAVVAVPDPLYHEVGCAFVIRRPGGALDEAEIAAFCRARLANYKVPKRFVVRDALPMLAIGKLDKAALRDEALRLRGAAESLPADGARMEGS
ncbi:MAG: class I adenylate-forming enzyme family protein [Dongiaceae bacterium]